MATIKEIAELAGVSRGTVDRVLNNRGSVNPRTARKILEIAQALDYKPNKAGIVLAAQKKNLKKPNGAKPGFVIYHTNYSMVAEPKIQGIEEVK